MEPRVNTGVDHITYSNLPRTYHILQINENHLMNVTDMTGCQFEGENEFRSSDTIYQICS